MKRHVLDNEPNSKLNDKLESGCMTGCMKSGLVKLESGCSRWLQIASLVLLVVSANSLAIDLNPVSGSTLEISNILGYGAQWRVEGADSDNVNRPATVPANLTKAAGLIENSNDGNLNWGEGMVSSRFRIISEVKFQYRTLGFFLRGRGWYDNLYSDGETDFPDTGNVYNDTTRGELPEETVEYLGSKAEFLDAYIFGGATWGGRTVEVRAGRQVISWGESLFYQNGISSAQNPVDANAGTSAGVEIKEIFLPTGAVSMQLELSEQFSFEGYVQYEHKPIVMTPAGSYFSEYDFLGDGGDTLDLGGGATITRKEIDGEDSGQWGTAVRYFSDSGAEYGFYVLNYHDKALSYKLDLANSQYETFYMEDIRLYGLSYGTVWGTSNIGAEISYRPNSPVVSGALLPTVERAEYVQAQLSAIAILAPSKLYDTATLTAETVAWDVLGYDDQDLDPTNSASGWAYALKCDFEYKTVRDGLDIILPLYYEHGVDGSMFRTNTRHHARRWSVGVTAKYLQAYEASLNYTVYSGIDDFGLNAYSLRDRDNIALSLKYTF